MIISSLSFSERIERLHPLFKTLFDYVKQHDWMCEELGLHPVKGDDLFILNIQSEGVKQEVQPLEAHRSYIDIHILLEGRERFGWKSISEVCHNTKPYNEEEDCALYSEPATLYVDLMPNEFVIVYPEDPHAPLIGEGTIRKLIAKVRL